MSSIDQWSHDCMDRAINIDCLIIINSIIIERSAIKKNLLKTDIDVEIKHWISVFIFLFSFLNLKFTFL